MVPDSLVEEMCRAFLGKICTVITQASNVPTSAHHSKFFTGEVTRLDNYGVWLRSVESNCLGFFQFPVIGLIEERVVRQGDPEFNTIAESLKAQKAKPVPGSSLIDVEELKASMRRMSQDK